MTAILWFLLGAAVATAFAARRARRHDSAPPQAAEPEPLPNLAIAVNRELAPLASGIAGTAQLLCEAADYDARTAARADQLCSAVRRLRSLSETLQVALTPPEAQLRSVNLEDVLLGAEHELHAAWCGRLQICFDTATSLPAVITDHRILQHALLLLVDLLTAHEPSGSRLMVRSRTRLQESTQAVTIELSVEVDSEHPLRPDGATKSLAERAARNLLAALGAEWRIQHIAGHEVTAWVALPACSDVDAAPAPPPSLPLRSFAPHEFGGAIVCDRDPAVRFMIGQELERSGRKVFLCGDQGAAMALLRATPERFELLISDTSRGCPQGHRLVLETLRKHPQMRAVLLGATADASLLAESMGSEPRVAILPQPFGLLELRDALAALGAGVSAA